ncbi:hypothetical protein JX265_008001 [Neoarthrinium moseri]|uniref:CFEM domain-containing protein n=1 Tax=Neoarthrinium moseri TaxID=1658444 RepID=A0A9Q0AMN2_9PEZI|nr:uncharacterized protein JN550_004553 [Neoarthrinium moseri]KAI1849665.1 hypothetical protein JX266_004614 [Neoarthrinium moseri]KAI1865678.1 hypothetical protein JX265_008001 [Neoarthrinium moseri]KAI1871559.1 hypothetical protein JN550_004553 [Neoarthrinium moseri]
MQFKILAISALAALVAADKTLPEAVKDFPSCSLKCFADTAKNRGCSQTDFNCICKDTTGFAIRMGACVNPSNCNGFNAGEALGNLCQRWKENPSSTEVAAATSSLGAAVSAAPTNTNAAGVNEASFGLAGAAAVAALLV